MKKRQRISALLGYSLQYSLSNRLHQVASQLRQPYLDFVGEQGRLEQDRLSWWSTGFSWKHWCVSEFFLLLCYLKISKDLLAEIREQDDYLLIVIEDLWLFEELRTSLIHHPSAKFLGKGNLRWEMIRAFFLGMAKRCWWAVKMVRNYIRQRMVSGRVYPPTDTRELAAIYSFPLQRCLRSEHGWYDPFLPHLDEILEEQELSVRRFSPPESSGFERALAERQEYFIPLILYATVAGCCRSFLAVWIPHWAMESRVAGHSVGYLLRREWWVELSRPNLCIYRMFYECAANMFREGRWRVVAFPFENQPWEKLLTVCAKESGVRSIGIQHAMFSKFSLSYFLGVGESESMPLPDRVCASGPYPAQLLRNGGIPMNCLRETGSLRYGHLNGPREASQRTSPPSRSYSEVLVALPIDRSLSQHLLAAIARAFPSGGQEYGIRFHIKAHPGCPIRPHEIGFSAELAPQDFLEALQQCGLVMFTGSTVGPEALAMGWRVIRFCPELLLNVDPSEAFGEGILECTDSNIQTIVLQETQGRTHTLTDGSSPLSISDLFSPVKRNVFAELVTLN